MWYQPGDKRVTKSKSFRPHRVDDKYNNSHCQNSGFIFIHLILICGFTGLHSNLFILADSN